MAALGRKQPGQLTVVIKLGTSSIVDEKTHQPLLSILALVVETACSLQGAGYRVVIVSSGAIGVGMRCMNVPRRPKHLPQIQALAAIGQCKLMSLWDQLFGNMQQPVAQVLLTRNDIADRTQYQNAQNTFHALWNMGVIPIVNENDTLAVTEIKFGDNDTLSAITAAMVQADYLFLMTDVDCLYDRNPRSCPDAKPIAVVEDIDQLAADVSSAGSALGTGGMSTKIVAARLATSAGVTTVITKSSNPGNISTIIALAERHRRQGPSRNSSTTTMVLQDEGPSLPHMAALDLHSMDQDVTTSGTLVPLHTRFLPISNPIRDRHFWILHGLATHGTIYIDDGAGRALTGKAGLLPAGIVDVDGHFAQQEAVRIVAVKRLSSSLPKTASAVSSPKEHAVAAPLPARHPLTHTTTASSHMTHPLPYESLSPAPFEIGRAIVNYSAAECRRIKGLHSTQISEALGYADSEYVALRENIALSGFERSRPTSPTVGKGTDVNEEGT